MAFRITVLLKAMRQLGFSQLALYGLYKTGLRTGYFRWADDRRRTTARGQPSNLHGLFTLPSSSALKEILGSDGLDSLLFEANQIAGGRFRIFGGELTEIELGFEQPLSHWTAYETHKAPLPDSKLPAPDIKFIWEPARFGWAFTLGRAYRVSGDDKYAEAFWRYFETFDAGNPPYLGPHWMSGQEVALRLMTFVWSAQVFGDSPESTRQRKERLAQSAAEHAARIPPTLPYARAQNNNHLTSEAAGLLTAALALPDHPQAGKWRRLGEKWMAWCFENQIDGTGEYIQHSVTYQRLMLQLALWAHSIHTKVARGQREKEEMEGKTGASSCALCLTEKARQNLAAATRWLVELTDPVSGQAVNLGADDGAYIFPLANGDFRDARPVAAAAARVFLDEQPFGVGAWDEMPLWFGGLQGGKFASSQLSSLPTLKPAGNSWAYLRVADGNLRLAHADQLHLDLWWRGENVALDPGTYLYNAAPPWDNPWPATRFHNTVTVDGLDQMTRAGRFMYLDWARGCVLEQSSQRIVAEHDGYRKLGVTHRRAVSFARDAWRIEDDLIPGSLLPRAFRLHWLLPDWEWEVEESRERVEISLKLPYGLVKVVIGGRWSTVSLARAGRLIYGAGDVPPTRGWVSPTYGVKKPALSFTLETTSSDAVKFTSEFIFPDL